MHEATLDRKEAFESGKVSKTVAVWWRWCGGDAAAAAAAAAAKPISGKC